MGKFDGKEEYHDIYPEYNEAREPLIKHKARSGAEAMTAVLMTVILTGTVVAGMASVVSEVISSVLIRPSLKQTTESSATVEVISDLSMSDQNYPLPYELYAYSGETEPVSGQNTLLLSQEEMERLGDADRNGNLMQAREVLEFDALSNGTYLLVFPQQEENGGKGFRKEALMIPLPGKEGPQKTDVETPIRSHTVTVVSEAGGTGLINGSGGPIQAAAGETVSVGGNADAGYTTDSYRILSGTVKSQSSSGFVMGEEDVTIEVIFKRVYHVSAFVEAGLGTASISADTGTTGDVITFAFTPGPDQNGQGIVEITGTGTYTDSSVTVEQSDIEIHILRAPDTAHSVIVRVAGEGTAEAPASAKPGETVSITMNPARGYGLYSVSVNGIRKDSDTFVMGSEDAYVAVEFCPVETVPILVAGGKGAIKVIQEYVLVPNMTMVRYRLVEREEPEDPEWFYDDIYEKMGETIRKNIP